VLPSQYWFSHGCSPSCPDRCDGTFGSPGHDDATYAKFLYKGLTKAEARRRNVSVPHFSPAAGDMALDPRALPRPVIRSHCGSIRQPTICAGHLRTLNTQAACGSAEDIYQLSPWRAPGAAPVIDSCGTAGGRLPGMGEEPTGSGSCRNASDPADPCRGNTQAIFSNSSAARENDRGSELRAMPSQATWRAGGRAEVGFSLKYQHGGGYLYRLAPAAAPLTEALLNEMVLPFVGESYLRWDGDARTQLAFNATRTAVGTVPVGSSWQKMPIPRTFDQWDEEGPAFEPPCAEVAGRECSGNPPNLEIVDVLAIPPHATPGRYVLNWRWDVEETMQVWESCSDVTIVA
jgi:hypothetical protein